MRLREDQAWFARAVMDGTGASEASVRLTRGPRLNAGERLDIYRRAYQARLVECLADDYPVLRHALGAEAFEELCRVYVARHPSESPSLNAYGAKMASFCRDEASEPFPLRGFATDLARLEWAIVEVIHAPTGEPLTMEALAQVDPERWGEARLEPIGALRVLRFEYPVNAYFQAVRDERVPAVPGAEPSATLVHRGGLTVWRTDLTLPMFEVLRELVSGQTLGASLAVLDASVPPERVSHWFREWMASGLFTRCRA